MQKIKTISLLFIVGILIFPWQLVCFTHPLGHQHVNHEPGKLSPCELRKQFKGAETAIFPAMHCLYSFLETDDFQATEKFQIKLTNQTLAFANVFLEIIIIDSSEQSFLFPPEPKCRSATIISTHSLRSPPFC